MTLQSYSANIAGFKTSHILYGHDSNIISAKFKKPYKWEIKVELIEYSTDGVLQTNIRQLHPLNINTVYNMPFFRTYIRGQNISIEPDELIERERKRQKAKELQDAIRQQVKRPRSLTIKKTARSFKLFFLIQMLSFL